MWRSYWWELYKNMPAIKTNNVYMRILLCSRVESRFAHTTETMKKKTKQNIGNNGFLRHWTWGNEGQSYLRDNGVSPIIAHAKFTVLREASVQKKSRWGTMDSIGKETELIWEEQAYYNLQDRAQKRTKVDREKTLEVYRGYTQVLSRAQISICEKENPQGCRKNHLKGFEITIASPHWEPRIVPICLFPVFI